MHAHTYRNTKDTLDNNIKSLHSSVSDVYHNNTLIEKKAFLGWLCLESCTSHQIKTCPFHVCFFVFLEIRHQNAQPATLRGVTPTGTHCVL